MLPYTSLPLILVTGLDVAFGLSARDTLLIVFFTTVGLAANLSLLAMGGVMLVTLTLVAMANLVVQNCVGVGLAALMGYPPATGLIAGSAALSGGHGTVLAWGPSIGAQFGIPRAQAMGAGAQPGQQAPQTGQAGPQTGLPNAPAGQPTTAPDGERAGNPPTLDPTRPPISRGGAIIHEVGTVRMGDDPQTSPLNKFSQSHDVKNLFVADAAPFVSNADKNPTHTIIALAWRTAEYLAEEMRKGNV